MALHLFHPLIQEWFAAKFGEPTPPQQDGWPAIAANEHTLIAAPTGSGKTLAAFLVCLDRLWRRHLNGELGEHTHTVYVSPLKALSNDIEKNLAGPLAELHALARERGMEPPPLRVQVRTGDTPAAERARMLRKPPHILVTTPESLYLLVTSARSRERLRQVETVIVDEIHALARDKRGSHLALTLERLAALCERPPVRIGLSATQSPIGEIANFLVGVADETPAAADAPAEAGAPVSARPRARSCRIVDSGHVRALDLDLELPETPLAAVCSLEQWGEVYQRLVERVQAHRSTLVFVNTRRMAERVAHHLTELLGPNQVASHHGSLSREIRLAAEQRLKSGELKAIVATASLELGIDIGYIDLVCQIGSPRSIATFLQRVGRAGHSLRATPKGRLFPLTRDELLESLALLRAVRRRELDAIEIPAAPLDILAQQIIAEVAAQEWSERDLLNLVRRAWPFRHLPDTDYEAVLRMVSEGLTPKARRGAHLYRDQIQGLLRPRRGARHVAIASGGAIPEAAEYRVVAEPDGTVVGRVDEDFAIESSPGDIFLLGNTSWRILSVRGQDVNVRDAEGAPPTIPFWFGEAPGRTWELSLGVSQLRAELACRVPTPGDESLAHQAGQWVVQQCGVQMSAALQAVRYVEAQVAALGVVPCREKIVFERFFDESGGMQLVIHSPLGIRVNRAWGLAMRKRFCRSFDFELQAAADDDGILLSLGPQHSFAIDALFKMLGPHNGQELLEQALLVTPMFGVRWRWNATRALAVLRSQNGKRVPPFLQKFRAEDLLAAVFPETVGCLENHSGNIEIPDHPLVRQTVHDCLTEAMDVPRWLATLEQVRTVEIELLARETREPSPFSHEIINANPYAFLDGAPLEERRTRAVTTRRGLSLDDLRELGKLDPAAISQVRAEAWPLVRGAEELHEALHELGLATLGECEPWRQWLPELVRQGRAAHVRMEGGPTFVIAAERWPEVQAVFPAALAEPALVLPPALQRTVEATAALVALVRGRLEHAGPITAEQLVEILHLRPEAVFAACEAIEAQGLVMRGYYSEPRSDAAGNGHILGRTDVEWCDRRLLARIHRLTLEGLRRSIRPAEPEEFLRFLARWQHVLPGHQLQGDDAVRTALAQLQGCELAAGAWEHSLLANRVADFRSPALDHLFLTGEWVWGRLNPPPRDSEQGPSMAPLTRVIPLSLLQRESLPWLLGTARQANDSAARANAQAVLAALAQVGAQFFPDLARRSGLLYAQLEEALRELAALGLVTSDAFAAVRAIVAGSGRSPRGRGRQGRVLHGRAPPIGRWSLFPGEVFPCDPADGLQHWAHQLLQRYGVIFRELVAREPAAPSWHALAPTLRRLELRGEIRGGRFISGVAGEQFAGETAVTELRQVRDLPAAAEPWFALAAADPLNLVGIVAAGPRVPAVGSNSLVVQGGKCVAAKISGSVQFFREVDPVERNDMVRALRRGHRPAAQTNPAAAAAG